MNILVLSDNPSILERAKPMIKLIIYTHTHTHENTHEGRDTQPASG